MNIYGLIGYPLGHSFSANYFNNKFKKEEREAIYELFPIPSIGELDNLLSTHPDLKGLNVTIPYKQQVIPFLDSVSKEAKEIGAVNVIKIIEASVYRGLERRLKGFNTDYIGFRDSLIPLLADQDIKSLPTLQNKKTFFEDKISQEFRYKKDAINVNDEIALVLGTGGASKAVCYALSQLDIPYILVSSHPGKNIITYNDISKKLIERCNLIINTTPLGMSPKVDTYPDIPYQYIKEGCICYDLVYNPEETEFLRKCREKGAVIKNGLEMLYIQAEAAWEIWNNDIF